MASLTRSVPMRQRRSLWPAAALVVAAMAAAALTIANRHSPAPVHAAGGDAFPFPCLPMEGAQQHLHPFLRIVMSGEAVTIPPAIGIRGWQTGRPCFEPVHTHDASGIIHIESTSPSQLYTLADFFTIWRVSYHDADVGGRRTPVSYTPSEIFGKRTDAAHPIRLLVDGRRSTAGPDLVLNTLDYCSVEMTGPPCSPSVVGAPHPPLLVQRYGTGHTIVLQYGAGTGS
jgi:hypothetical protein